MSRFSLSEAKGLGWVITHLEKDGEDGKPKWIEAVKRLNAPGFPDKLVTEGAETIGLLLERVFAYEAHLKSLGYPQPEPFVPEVEEQPVPKKGKKAKPVVDDSEPAAD